MKTGIGKLGLLGVVLSLVLSARSFADAGVEGDHPKIEVYCTLSTRVVALDLRMAMSPMEGALSYSLSKYHALEPAQNYQSEGNNRGAISQSLTVSKNLGMIKIHATGKRLILHPRNATGGNFELVAHLVKTEGALQYKLKGLMINGRDQLIGARGTTFCEMSH